jgi:hypothetical protein
MHNIIIYSHIEITTLIYQIYNKKFTNLKYLHVCIEPYDKVINHKPLTKDKYQYIYIYQVSLIS